MSKKAILIISGTVLVGGVSYLIYKKWKGDREVTALSDYIANKTYDQLNTSAGADQAIDNITNTKIDTNKIHIGGLFGVDSPNSPIRAAVLKTVQDLNKAIKGGGTSVTAFLNAFYTIKNQNTMALVDAIYKGIYKEGLFDAMKKEVILNNPLNKMFDENQGLARTLLLPSIPSIKGSWIPQISQYLQNLPEYS